MYIDSMIKKDCCGCSACEQICGVNAIRMEADEQGFSYPVFDFDKCVHCGLCTKVCPMEKNYVKEQADPYIYAFSNKKKDVLEKSSSGGMFTVLSDWILEKNGTVYGAAFDRDFNVRHCKAETAGETSSFRTSKYVQSDFSDVYQSAAADLKDGRYVLVTGTPCQIAAITEWLSIRRVPTEKFYTLDVICHGVPSPKIWQEYLEIIRRKYIGNDNYITAVNMRSKKESWENQKMDIQTAYGDLSKDVDEFDYNELFHSLNIIRESCFHCRYTSFKRPSDFTIGDFWNYSQANLEFDPDGGLNEVLINTEKGRRLFLEIKDQGNWQRITKEVCWQPHLEYSAKEPASREQFWNDYAISLNKENVMRKYMKGSMVVQVIRTVTPVLRKTGLYVLAGKMYRTVFGKK